MSELSLELAELAELSASVRALLEWHEMTGSDGLPGDASARGDVESPEVSSPWEQVHEEQGQHTTPRSVPTRGGTGEVSSTGLTPAKRHSAVVAGPELSPDERKTRLALVAEKVRTCTACPLHEKRTNTVFARGNPFAELCFVGEGPGADEDAQGEPFVGKAGQLLDKMIGAMGYARDDVYICNIVKCRPPENRKPEPHEMTTCMPYLTEQLTLVQPKVIVALGATAIEGLLGISGGITRLRGKWKLYKGQTPVMPTFHPAYLLRQPNAKREVWSDLQEVMRLLGRAPAKPQNT